MSVLDEAPLDGPASGPTQRTLTPPEVVEIVHRSLGPRTVVVRAEPLTGGGFATVWRADLDDGTSVVLKLGPPPGAPLLTYEADMIEAEADYLRKVRAEAPAVPVPEILYQGTDPSVVDGSWLILGLLPGTALAELRERIPREQQAAVRRELGRALARLHRVGGTAFGYPGRLEAATWRAAYRAVIDELLADAERFGQELPMPAEWIRDVLGAASEALAPVARPTLVHFDLWDGNVLAAAGPDGRWHLTGLVDGERSLYADPLVDFVSADHRTDIEDDPDHPFTAGYAEEAGPEFVLDGQARRRILLYRAWLYLLMRVEFPARLLSSENQLRRHDALREVLLKVQAGG